MVTSGALMALRLTANDISSDQVSPQAECIGSRARKARNMALELRQKHLDAKLQVKDRPARMFQETLGGTSGPGPGGWKGYDGPQFSGRLEDSGWTPRRVRAQLATSSPWTSWTCCCARYPQKRPSGGDGGVRRLRKTYPTCSMTSAGSVQQS
jgi:hypothetical protein